MDELQLQAELVMQYFCSREDEGGLGYRNVPFAIVSKDLFIPSVLGEFIENSQPEVWSRLKHSYHGDEQTLLEDLKNTIKERFLDKQNVAIFFNSNKSITFCNETVTLFYVPGSELRGDEDFKKNIFCAVSEYSHTISYKEQKVNTIRPDISFFLNGIYFGYMELKCNSQGQSAKDHGRGKILKDYLSTIKDIVIKEKNDRDIKNSKKELLAIYEKAIHLTSTDINETYVIRGISQYYDTAHANFSQGYSTTVESLVPELLKPFKLYPVSSPILSSQERFKEVAKALYSKLAIKNEILYYNFIEYKYERQGDRRVRTNNSGHLISPRPKQKFGCDKIMSRIQEMLDHEDDPDYFNNKLRRELYAMSIPQAKVEEIITQRDHYCNNKYVYSLLMQYAAGFGKSNIIGWTALQLKDYRHKGEYAYNKILLVVDRLQLRGQLDERMWNMNIDRSMFVEATDKQTFIRALDDQRRIIVVNIQKFLDLQAAIDESGTKLKQMRVAFLIDEIHRSNSGENNERMIDLFEKLQASFNSADHTNQKKKNLLIGFTATPSDETLCRFGEFRSATNPPLWIPFDSYTMKEAIEDGFVLDPTKHIIPYNVPVAFELPEDLEPDADGKYDAPKVIKSQVYSYEPRMETIAKFIVERLVSLVYGKIRGEGKAMLAVSSIPNAIKYFSIIKKLYEEKCQEPIYQRYKDAPIAIVYSDNQENESSASLNNGVGEERVIENFKNAKNGLIIVVDKLQTGFDEPKLHTLFLDKEIKDINAIQTISRVNRTCKYKNECHVIDFSWQNVNTKFIKEAFQKYCDMTISQFNPETAAKEIQLLYKDLTGSEPYKQWFPDFKVKKDETDFIMGMEQWLRDWIRQWFLKEKAAKKYNADNHLIPGDSNYVVPKNDAKDLRTTVGAFASAIEDLRNVYTIDEKYTESVFLEFWNKYCNIFKIIRKEEEGNSKDSHAFEVIDSDEVPGITLVDPVLDDGDDSHGPKGTKRTNSTPKGKTLDEILELLLQLNNREVINAREAQIWLREIGKCYDHLKNIDKLCAILKDLQTSDEDKLKEFKKQLNLYKTLKLRNRTDLLKLEEFKQMLDDNMEHLFAIFLTQLLRSEEDETDFDFDTTTEEDVEEETQTQDSPVKEFTWEELMELAMKKLRPSYNEDAIKERIKELYEPCFTELCKYMRGFDEIIDSLFVVLNTPSLITFTEMETDVKDALNVLMMAEGLVPADIKKNTKTLVLAYEGYLKKLAYLVNGREVTSSDSFKAATMIDAIMAIDSLKNLRYNRNPIFKELDTRQTNLRDLRNHISAHYDAAQMTDEKVTKLLNDTMIMYLYAAGSNITELESNKVM